MEVVWRRWRRGIGRRGARSGGGKEVRELQGAGCRGGERSDWTGRWRKESAAGRCLAAGELEREGEQLGREGSGGRRWPALGEKEWASLACWILLRGKKEGGKEPREVEQTFSRFCKV